MLPPFIFDIGLQDIKALCWVSHVCNLVWYLLYYLCQTVAACKILEQKEKHFNAVIFFYFYQRSQVKQTMQAD